MPGWRAESIDTPGNADATYTTPGEQREAAGVAASAVRSLLTFHGNIAAYNRAQARFYPTAPATESHYTADGPAGPPPTLAALPAPHNGSAVADGGLVWRLAGPTADRSLAVSDAVAPREAVPRCLTPVVDPRKGRLLHPRVRAGRTDSPSNQPLFDSVTVRGDATVTAGPWVCIGNDYNTLPALKIDLGLKNAPAARRRVPWEATVERVPGARWRIASLDLTGDHGVVGVYDLAPTL